MKESIAELGSRHVSDVRDINRGLLEKALQMRCHSYLSQIKSQLLTETIFEIDNSKKILKQTSSQLQKTNRLVVQQKAELQEKNRLLEISQEELEERIRERTSELLETNQRLTKEITERKQAESDRLAMVEKYLQAQKMETIGRLAAGIAHEINNPLAVVLQNLQVARDRLWGRRARHKQLAEESGLDLQALQKYLQAQKIDKMFAAVEDGGKRAAAIVESMLSISRKSESRFAPRCVVSLLEDSLTMMEHDYDYRKKYDFRKIKIERDFADNIPDIPCTGLRIQQVFLNLLKNGAEAMLATDSSMVEPPCFRLKIQVKTPYLEIQIADNGPGIPDEELQSIFEPFYTTKDPGQGTGLGLSVSYFIVTEIHGGQMRAESQPGVGTCFTICLPLSRE